MGLDRNAGILLDTHTLIWWITGDRRLSDAAKTAILDSENNVFASVASMWKLTVNFRKGKLPLAEVLTRNVKDFVTGQNIKSLPITVDDCIKAGLLTEIHDDEFDRLLIARAQNRILPIVTNDDIFGKYDVDVLW